MKLSTLKSKMIKKMAAAENKSMINIQIQERLFKPAINKLKRLKEMTFLGYPHEFNINPSGAFEFIWNYPTKFIIIWINNEDLIMVLISEKSNIGISICSFHMDDDQQLLEFIK